MSPFPMLHVRSATLADIDLLVELARSTFRDAYREFDDPADIEDYVATHFTPATFGAIVADAASILWIAEAEDNFIGYVHIRRSTPPPCVRGAPLELTRLYLRQAEIGKGYGAVLMKAVIAEARRSKCDTVWLSVYDKNVRAVEFYKRWGFVDVGTKEFYFGGKVYNDPIMAAPVTLGRSDNINS